MSDYISPINPNIDERYFELWEDDDWFDAILKLDNKLLNVWIRAYYKRYWAEKFQTLSGKWQQEILIDCRQYQEYFDWIEIRGHEFPYVKDDIALNNKECCVLWHILENYSGLYGFDIGLLIYDCIDAATTTRYIDNIERTLRI